MTSADIIAALEAKFGDRIKSKKLDAIDPFAVVAPEDLVEVCRFLRDDPGLRFDLLNCVSGVDYFEPDPKKAPKAGFEPHLEVVYHMQSFAYRHRFVLKVSLPRWKGDKPGQLPEVPTVTGVWPAADWHEREVYDLCGVWFVGHPDPRRMLLAEDWEGHPLRKDYEFPLEYHGIRGR
jgi:NADH-quinone oxidoreductase subunit C